MSSFKKELINRLAALETTARQRTASVGQAFLSDEHYLQLRSNLANRFAELTTQESTMSARTTTMEASLQEDRANRVKITSLFCPSHDYND